MPYSYFPRQKYKLKEQIARKSLEARQKGLRCAFTIDRVSSNSQEDGVSLEYQNEAGRATAQQDGFKIIHNFSFIESASKEKRPWFRFMLQCAQAYLQEGDRVYFKDATRAARNLPDINLIDEIRKTGISFKFYALGLTLEKDTHPSIVMSFLVQGVIGKHETDNMGWRISEALNHKLTWGVKPCGMIWGFKYDKKRKIYELDPKVAPKLRYIFKTFDNGNFNLREFAEHLNEKKIFNKNGNPWTRGNIYKVLVERPEYHGEFLWHGKIYRFHYDGGGRNIHPLGLEPETYYTRARWIERKKRIASMAAGKKRNRHNAHLKRLIRCGCCDDSLNIFTPDTKKSKYTYYKHRCRTKGRAVQHNEDEIFAMLDREIEAFRFSDSFAEKVENLFMETFDSQYENIKSDRRYIRTKTESLRQQIKKLYADFSKNPGRDHSILFELESELQSEIDALKKMGDMLDRNDTRINHTIVEHITTLRQMPLRYLEGGADQKAQILRSMIKAVYIEEGQSSRIEWQEPFNVLMDDEVFFAIEKGPGRGWKSGGRVSVKKGQRMSASSISFMDAESSKTQSNFERQIASYIRMHFRFWMAAS